MFKVDLVLVTVDKYTEQDLAVRYGISLSARRVHSDRNKMGGYCTYSLWFIYNVLNGPKQQQL
jgi:hypothetical protein